MPYSVKKKGDEFAVVNDETGKVYGTHPTRRKAIQQMKALYANTDESKVKK